MPNPDATARPGHLVPDHGYRILVVDDNQLLRDYVRTLLTSLRYEVATAANGPDALVLLASDQEVDLLFTDILLGEEMDGWQLAELARAMRPDLPVLFTSGGPELAAGPAGIKGDAKRVLRK
ncbi:MAG: response regulator [Hyphomonas sp.]|nr:response regulator [Hyphomonas sp.]